MMSLDSCSFSALCRWIPVALLHYVVIFLYPSCLISLVSSKSARKDVLVCHSYVKQLFLDQFFLGFELFYFEPLDKGNIKSEFI